MPVELIFLNIIKSQFKLNINSEHGITHWRRVAFLGDYLANRTGADKKVVNLFAYLHDSKRENELYDSEHGLRSSIYAKELYEQGLLEVSPSKLEQLLFACKYHSDPKAKSNDITVQTCWDADRLDLWRVGITPKKEFLSTDLAKEDKTIALARMW